jgi:signal peptidase II
MSASLNRSLSIGVLAVIVADWFSKFWVATRMAIGESVALIDGWLYLAHRKNPGVAFSLFADMPDAWRTPVLSFFSLLGVALFTWIVATTHDLLARSAAALVLAGAIANLGDRLLDGHVTDFVLMRHFPFVFNVADAAITVGALLLVLRLVASDAEIGPPRVPDAA